MMIRAFLGAMGAVCLVLGGCATYTPSMAKLDATGVGASKQTVGDVTVYVDEYVSKAKSEKTFDMDLREDGVLPLLVTLQNNGKQSLAVKTMDITLRDGANTLKMLSPEEAAQKAKKNAAGRAIGWSLIVPIISIPIAATASVMHTNKVNRQIREDFTAKNFSSTSVVPSKDATGFLFFDIEKARTEFSNLVLDIVAQFEGATETLKISTPISPVMVKAAEATAQPK